MDAHAGIIQALNLCGRAVDCQRWELFDEVFTAEERAGRLGFLAARGRQRRADG